MNTGATGRARRRGPSPPPFPPPFPPPGEGLLSRVPRGPRPEAGWILLSDKLSAGGWSSPLSVPFGEGGWRPGALRGSLAHKNDFSRQRWAFNIWCSRKVNEKLTLGLGPDQRCRMPQRKVPCGSPERRSHKGTLKPQAPPGNVPSGQNLGLFTFVLSARKRSDKYMKKCK